MNANEFELKLNSIIANTLRNKPGGERLSGKEIYKKYTRKHGINEDLDIVSEQVADIAHEMLIKMNLKERQEMGDLCVEDLYPLVQHIVSYHKRSLDEYNIEMEDVVQDVVIKAYNNFETFRGDSQISTWVFRIVKNEVINAIIHKNRKKRKATGTVSINQEQLDFEMDGSAIEDQILYEEMIKRAYEVVDGLENKRMKAVLMMILQGYDYKEVAEELNMTVGAVRQTMHLAKNIGL